MKKKKKNELTTREKQILKLFKFSMKDKEIGEKLCISHHTAHAHRKRIYKKLNAHSKLEAVIKGILLGYIDITQKE